ncbi:sugar ABC transporter ATPase [Microbacterium sp. Marseille-Q6965]|uniref:sugar ABC transporter ATPase n=1 Tax=Microbacterium sp. Marseille-Q6965 TaxID=2965072 RepID=UPI0021B7D98B|nr:sugar ABC transporter ATPase [Microbacterium sp. Marseille-Q6965]
MTNAADEGRERAAAAADEDLQDFDPLEEQTPNERDTSVTADPLDDPAQREWEGADLGDPESDVTDTGGRTGDVTGTGADPAEIPDDADQVPIEDLPDAELQPESQGEDPDLVDLGPDGQGDVSPEDL